MSDEQTKGTPSAQSKQEENTVTSNRKPNTGASLYNALDFLIDSQIKQKVNVAIPVRVDSCTKPGVDAPAGYVSATPLVTQRDAEGNALGQVSIPQLPFFRLSCGEAAIVADPQPGDVGLAVFAQSDISGLTAGNTEPVTPGSFRSFDMSDGIYLGGILGKTPKVYIHLDPEKGEITIKCPEKVTVETPKVEIKAENSVTLETPLVTVAGRIVQNGSMGGGASEFKGGFTNTGGNITSNGVTLETHTHHDSTGGSTGAPD